MTDKIISIQSKLVYGYVGSNIAELAIQLHGLDVIAFPTVYLSAHTGHQPVHGTKIDKALFDDLVTGVENLDILDSVAHIISGYIGSEDLLLSVIDFIKKIKADYPNQLYICDPVMGDEEGLYIDKNLANRIITALLPLCDITTPNHSEFNYIVGVDTKTRKEVVDAINNHSILKNKTVIITSCNLVESADNEIETLIVREGICTSITTSKVDIDTTGTGDLFTATTAVALAQGKDIEDAVYYAAEFVTRALAYTVEAGNTEMNAKSIVSSIQSL